MLSGIMVDYALLTNPSSAKLTGSGPLFLLEKRHISQEIPEVSHIKEWG